MPMMHTKPPHCRRHGAVLLEVAIVYPIAFMLILGLVIGGLGIFRYQEMAWLAREGARYASVRGAEYEREQQKKTPPGNKSVTQADLETYLRGLAVVPDPENVNVTLTWNSSNEPYKVTSDYEAPVSNTVTVTVTYTWSPEMYFGDPVLLSSIAVIPVSH
jgi:Flp pilus assembly protein TadG